MIRGSNKEQQWGLGDGIQGEIHYTNTLHYELTALMQGLRMAVSNNFMPLEVNIDSTEVTSNSIGESSCKSQLQRSRVADKLAKEAVAELNKKMKTGYSNNFFVELLRKTPDNLFADYKAKYKTA
uniref:RNase H type-1 domain-containing protein n=1 Tax=Nicotiana tabacum TaxID=4097 RepID=A0A1S3YM21_TOBAC|nr:PREDICTED: uncharacterized protein LOC107777463 [Nicotiana tabacum]